MKIKKMISILIILVISGCDLLGLGGKELKNPNKHNEIYPILKENIGEEIRPNLFINKFDKNYKAYVNQIEYATDVIKIHNVNGEPGIEKKYEIEVEDKRRVEGLDTYIGDETMKLIQKNFLKIQEDLNEQYHKEYPSLTGEYKIVDFNSFKYPGGRFTEVVLEYRGKFVFRTTTEIINETEKYEGIQVGAERDILYLIIRNKYNNNLKELNKRLKLKGYGCGEEKKNLFFKGISYTYDFTTSDITGIKKEMIKEWLISSVEKNQIELDRLSKKIFNTLKTNTFDNSLKIFDVKCSSNPEFTQKNLNEYKKYVKNIFGNNFDVLTVFVDGRFVNYDGKLNKFNFDNSDGSGDIINRAIKQKGD